MKHAPLICASLALTGCIFGGGDPAEDPVVINNNETPEVNIGSATVTEVDCTPHTPRFLQPDAPEGYALRPESVVDYEPSRVRIGLDLGDGGYASSVAWASVVDGTARVTIGGLRGEADTTPEKYWTADVAVGDGTELYFVELDARSVPNMQGAPLFEVTLGTSSGIRECIFEVQNLTLDYELEADCDGTFIQDRLKDVQAPEFIDYVPVLTRDGDSYVAELSNVSAVITASGRGPRDLNYFEAIHYDSSNGLFSPLSTAESVEPSLTPPDVFALRQGWGLGEAEGGWPALQLLARGTDGEYLPRVLVYTEDDGYVEQELGSWPLPPDVEISTKTFAFLDGYDAEAEQSGGDLTGPAIRFDATRSELRHGYAALSEDGGRLLLSRPGGVVAGSVDIVEADLGGSASELRAIRNIPWAKQLGTIANPIMVVVDGEDREVLSLIEWDFQTEVTILRDTLRGAFTDVRHISIPTLLSTQAGVLTFVGRRDGELGIGLFPFMSDEDDPSSRFDANVCSDK